MKVNIIGGGIIGCLTACMLKQKGADVVLLERGKLGQEASWAGAGILCPIHPWLYPDAFSEFVSDSLARYPALYQRLLDVTGEDMQYLKSGLMIPMFQSDDHSHRNDALAWSERFNWNVEEWGADKTSEHESSLNSEELESSLVWPEVAQLRNPRLLRAVQLWMRQLGIECYEGREINDAMMVDGAFRGVSDAEGNAYEADMTLLACGSWSGELAKQWGCQLPIQPVKGQIVLLKSDPGKMTHIVKHDDAYFVPRTDGRILVGASMEAVGFQRGTTPEVVRSLLNAVLHIAPGLKDAEIEHQWMGFRPGSPDGMPFIGPVNEMPGLWVASGHYRNGVCLAPGTAHWVSEWMMGNKIPEYLTTFLLGRDISVSNKVGYPVD